MNLKKMAQDALKVAKGKDEGSEQKVVRGDDTVLPYEDNGDGSVTFRISIEIDPKVQEKMAKAMPKGTQRADYADDLEDAEDEAIGPFQMALDEMSIAEDGVHRNPNHQPGKKNASRHDTPIENCRAIDPRFCPYHGQKALTKSIEDAIANALNPGGYSNNAASLKSRGITIDLRPGEKKGTFGLTVTSDINDATPVSRGILNAVGNGNTKGISFLSTGLTAANAAGKNEVIGEVEIASKPDEVALLDEWMDDLMIDLTAYPSLQNEVAPKDVAELLAARQGVEDALNGSSAQSAQYYAAMKYATDAYHSVRSQVDYIGISNQADAVKASDDLKKDVDIDYGDYKNFKKMVDDAKTGLWGKPRFPNGFAKNHPFVEEYNKVNENIGRKAFGDFYASKGEIDSNPMNISDKKYFREKFGVADYAAAMADVGMDAYAKAAPKFLADLYDWASQDPSVSQAQLQAAFPNGKPGGKPLTRTGKQANSSNQSQPATDAPRQHKPFK